MANITRTEGAVFIPTIVAQMALDYLVSNLIIQKMTQKYTEFKPGSFAQFGETLVIPKLVSLTVNDKGENANFTLQAPTSTSVSLVLNKHKEVSLSIERRAASLANQSVLSQYVKVAMLNMAEQVEKDIMATYTAATGGTIGTNVALTEANIQAAKKVLTDNKAPQGEKRYGIISTAQTLSLLSIDRLVTWMANGQANNIANAGVGSGNDDPNYNARLGRLYDFDMYETQNIPVVASVAKNLFFAEDTFIFASRPLAPVAAALGVETVTVTDEASGLALNMTYWYNGLAGAYNFTLECLYGVTLARPEHLVVVNTN